MADNPGIALQFFGDRQNGSLEDAHREELEVKHFARPGFIPPIFVPPIVGFHEEEEFDASGRAGGIPRPENNRRPTNPSSSVSNPGILIEGFYDLFWKNRLHILQPDFEAGNILSAIGSSFEIYNAGTRLALDVRGVNNITDLIAQGITIISGNVATPFALGLGQSEVYEYVISTSGPATINGSYDFTFDNGVILSHIITGSRVFMLLTTPQGAFTERWKWLTDVLRKADGSEQRISVRDIPRQQLLHRFLSGSELENIRLENAIYGRMPDQIAIPFYKDTTTLTTAVAIDDVLLTLVDNPQVRQFREDEPVIIFDLSTGLFEVGNVDTGGITATTITLAAGLLSGWPAGAEVSPVKLAYVNNQQRQRLHRVNARELNLTFDVQENFETPDESSFPTYQSIPLYDLPLLLPDETYARAFDFEVDKIDFKVGRIFQSTIQNVPSVSHAPYMATWHNRSEYNTIKDWFMARRGRQKVFWMATARNDLFPAILNSAPIAVIDSEITGYETVFNKGTRKHIEIEYADGSIDRREVTDVETTANFERLTIDSDISQDWSPANVVRVSHLIKVCLNMDDVEFVHPYPDEGFVRFIVREVQA